MFDLPNNASSSHHLANGTSVIESCQALLQLSGDRRKPEVDHTEAATARTSTTTTTTTNNNSAANHHQQQQQHSSSSSSSTNNNNNNPAAALMTALPLGRLAAAGLLGTAAPSEAALLQAVLASSNPAVVAAATAANVNVNAPVTAAAAASTNTTTTTTTATTTAPTTNTTEPTTNTTAPTTNTSAATTSTSTNTTTPPPPPHTIIDSVGPNDVVCGRGKGSYNRPGNKQFRQICQSYIPRYLQAKSKGGKSRLLSEILHVVHLKNGRFLKQAAAGWQVIPRDLAREKIGHAMRETLARTKAGTASAAVSASTTATATTTAPTTTASSNNNNNKHSEWLRAQVVVQAAQATAVPPDGVVANANVTANANTVNATNNNNNNNNTNVPTNTTASPAPTAALLPPPQATALAANTTTTTAPPATAATTNTLQGGSMPLHLHQALHRKLQILSSAGLLSPSLLPQLQLESELLQMQQQQQLLSGVLTPWTTPAAPRPEATRDNSQNGENNNNKRSSNTTTTNTNTTNTNPPPSPKRVKLDDPTAQRTAMV